jgi:signal transduction histidine kinase/DNA-binding response OmpR family regulator/ligand-binding sensor domain-containing protein
MKYRYLFPFLFFVTAGRCFAQYSFRQLDNSAGLSNSCINSVCSDSDNLLWFGTWDGLNFYDGRNVHVFNYERADLKRNSIASNVIYQVEEDKQRNIWTGTVEGVSKFNKQTGVFSNYFYSSGKVVSNGYTVAINSKGEVYAARRNGSQLYAYDQKSDRFKKVVIQNLPDFMLLRIFFDEQDRLWLLKDNGKLEVFRFFGSQFVKVDGYAPVDSLDNVFYCNHRVFYTTRSNELFRVLPGLRKEKLAALPHEVRAMAFFNNQYVFAWSSQGMGAYDADFKPVNSFTAGIPLLQNVRVTSLTADRNHLLWAGTDGNGVIKITPKENQFGLMQQLANGQSFHVPVRAFCEVKKELWIGTKGNGIVALKNWDHRNVSFSDIRTFHTNVDLLDNCVYAIQQGRDGLVYIGSDAAGVTVYDPGAGKFVKWEEVAGSSHFAAFGSVHCILNDADGSLWLGLNEDGLVHLKIAQAGGGQLRLVYLKQYKYDGSNTGPGNNVIYSLAQGKDGLIWIGCRYGGLSVFDKQIGRFRTLKAFRYQGSLSNNDVLSLFIDAKDRLWVGTSFGLNWVNESETADSPTPLFRKLYVDDGLPNNTIHAINGDEDGHIWLSTNKGLAKVDPQSLSVIQYKESDGLQSDEFSDNATWKNAKGMLFFGGIYGFNYFMPSGIHSNDEQPPLLLNGLQLAGKTSPENGLNVLTKNGAVSKQHFTLMPGDNYFELNLQPVTYTQQQKCQYASFLKGDDKAWHYMGNQERIVYNNIPPGNYALMIKWSNGEGTWTKAVAAFSISVKQYFWLTTPAFVAYTLMLFAGAYVYLSYKKKKFIVTQELRLEHMLREKDEKIHQEQLNFFTNIAHELQTPLTLILGSLERFLFKNKGAETREGGRFLSIAKQEASRLQYLVQQLMEFRKAASGRLESHYENFNVSALLEEIAGLFVALVDEKNLDFSWQIEPGLVLNSDRDKLEKIVFNLLSNAFKYAGREQYIILTVNALQAENSLEIILANSGCRLTTNETEQLFDRFFVADAKEKNSNSTGIGLAFTRQLVQLLGGEVTSVLDKEWISFKVVLPLKYGDVPAASEDHEQPVGPSYLVNAMTQVQGVAPLAGNNKKALVGSFNQKEKRSVLIVEDDQLIRFLLRDILTGAYVIYESATGLEAMELMKRVMPDIIVSDIMMPDMDGLELCRLVKNTTETCHIPFILLSARTAIEQQTEGYDCGADAYIAKPFQTEHLLVRIEKLLEYRGKLHEAFRLNNSGVRPAAVDVLNANDRNFIEKATRLIEDNIDEDLDSAFLERSLNLSKIQVYRKLKTLSDMTPTELIRQVRLQKASGLLLNTNLTVNEVFYRTGFNNKTYFYREFKKLYNCSPNDYRTFHRLPDLHKS